MRLSKVVRIPGSLQSMISGILLLIVTGLGAAPRTITADVTGDNMNDAIKVTDDAVYVVDRMLCCTRKRFPVVSSCDSIYDVIVDDFSKDHRGKEIGIVFGNASPQATVVYAFDNGRFSIVSENLPGMIAFHNSVLCSDGVYLLDSERVILPWPVIEDHGFLKQAVLASSSDSTVTIESGEVLDDTLTLPLATYLLIALWTQSLDIIATLYDGSGVIIRESDHESPVLVSMINTSNQNQARLHIDNSRSRESSVLRCQIHAFECFIKD